MNDTTQTATFQPLRRTITTATLLRSLGAMTMVGSLSVFLLHGFEAQGDRNRVLMLLGQSALLASAGLFVGSALREPKGARVFLSVCLISVPANFAVLGAMIYSIVPLDGEQLLDAYPGFARWEAASLAELGTAIAAGITVLAPISFFAIAVMARSQFKLRSCALIATSATLLLPLRDPALMTIIAGLIVLTVFSLLSHLRRKRETIGRPATFEERFVHSLLLLPPMIMVARALMMSGVHDYSALPVSIALYFALCAITRACTGTVRRQAIFAILASVAAAATALSASVLVALHLPYVLATPIFALVLAYLLHHLARQVD